MYGTTGAFSVTVTLNNHGHLFVAHSTATVLHIYTDLAATATDGLSTDTAAQGDAYTIPVTVTNNGSLTLSSISFVDSIPAGLLKPTFKPSVGSYNSITHVWSGLSLAPGKTVEVDIQGTIDPAATSDQVNTATVAPVGGLIDTNTANNTTKRTIKIGAKVDVAITNTDGKSAVAPGGTTTYTVVVTNNGPGTASNISVKDPLPTGVTSFTWSGNGKSNQSGALADTIPILASGSSVTYTVVAAIGGAATGSVKNTATITVANDSDNTNDSALDVDDLSLLTPLVAKVPAGGLIYDPVASGTIAGAGDTGSYQLSLVGNQTLTLVMTAGSGLTGNISLVDPSNNLIASATAGAPGANVIIQSASITTAGTYVVNVSGSSNSTGAYTVQAILNAAYKQASDGINSIAGAFDLTSSFTTPSLTFKADRAGVIGVLGASADYYKIPLTAGQGVSVAIKGKTSAADIGLYDASGTQLAMSGSGSGVDGIISGFAASATGNYFVKVTGAAALTYDLVVTRGMDFDVHGSSIDSPQPLSGTNTVLGAIAVGGNTDWYSFNVNAGDNLLLKTATPGGSVSSGRNYFDDLNPSLSLFDDSGNLVAAASGNASDGRNDVIDWTALTSGTYRVQVTGGQESTIGEYILGVQGATGGLSSISGTVYNDLNGGGTQVPVDFGLVGWEVDALDSTGHVVDAALTDADGNYTLHKFLPGSLTIAEVLQKGWQQTQPANAAKYSVAGGGEVSGKDFGNFQLVSVSGHVYNDLDGNGHQNQGEPGLQGFTLNVLNGFSAVVGTAMSDSNGDFTVTDIGPGSFTLSEVAKPEYTLTQPVNPNNYPFSTSSGSNRFDAIFGNEQNV